MLVLVLWACLASEPARCISINLPGRYGSAECQIMGPEESRRFERRYPEWRVSRAACQRLRGRLA